MMEVDRDTTEGRDQVAVFSMQHPSAVMVRSPREGNFAYLFEDPAEYNLYVKRHYKLKRKRGEQHHEE